MNTLKKVLSWYKKSISNDIKLSAFEQVLQWYKFEGEVGAPPGNSNACKPGVGEGSNCGGGGGIKQTPENNSEMKSETDKINNETEKAKKQIESMPGDPEFKKAMIDSIEERKSAKLDDLDEKYNPVIEVENQNNRFKTASDATKYLNEKLKIEGNLDGFDINNGGLNTPNKIIESIERFYDDHPEMSGLIKKIDITPSSKTGYLAAWDHNTQTLSYNSRMSETGISKKTIKKPTHYSVPNPSINYLIDHEVGHGVVGDYIKTKNQTFYITDPDLKSVYDDFISNAKKSSNSEKYYIKNLSGYAQVSPHEFLAEAWAEYRNSPNPRPTAQKIGEIITSKIKKK